MYTSLVVIHIFDEAEWVDSSVSGVLYYIFDGSCKVQGSYVSASTHSALGLIPRLLRTSIINLVLIRHTGSQRRLRDPLHD